MDYCALFEHVPCPYLVLLANPPVFTTVAVNAAYLRAAKMAREDVVGRGVFEVLAKDDHFASQTLRDLGESLNNAMATRVPDRTPIQRYELWDGSGVLEEHYWASVNIPVVGGDGKVEYLIHSHEGVTKQERAARRDLQTSEVRFRQLAESATMGLVISDLEGSFRYLNAAARELLGYTEEEVAAGGVRWDRITPLEFAQADATAAKQLAETGRCAPYEKEYVAKGGQHVPVLVGASMLDASAGGKEVAAFLLDLTERKRTELRDAFLVRLDDATRSLLDANEIMRTTVQLLGEYLDVDRCAYFCFEPDQETFAVRWDYLSPGMPSIVGRHTLSHFDFTVARLFRANEPYIVDDIDTDARTPEEKSGYRQACIWAHASVPLHKDGKLVSGIAVHQKRPRHWQPEEVELVRLVANRCWESIERTRLAHELRDRELRLRLAQRAGRIGSFEWLMTENQVIWTPELEALYGMPEGSFEGSFEHWSRSVVADDAVRVTSCIQDCIARRQAECLYEFRAVLPDGRHRWLRGQAQFTYDVSGEPVRMIGINIDIDEQKATQEAVAQSQKLESIGLLAGGIAHDFNNLLVGIMGGASFAVDIIDSSHPAHEVLRGVVEASERAAHLTRQMLAYAGKGKFFIEPVDLTEVAVRTAEIVSASIPKTVQVKFQTEDSLPAVHTDVGQIEQVAMNLIINAAEAIGENRNGLVLVITKAEEVAPGDNRRDVTGSSIPPGLYAVLEVKDNGSGIEQATLIRIFDPFFTTKFTGRGLGLAAVHGIVRSHQGAIEVETELGKGSTFRVLLPAQQSRLGARAATQASETAAIRAIGSILVIDDEAVVRSVAKNALEHVGYRVVVAATGDEGLECIQQDPEISAVLLDMSMPEMSGREVLESLKATRPKLTVIICSGYSEDEIYRQFSGLEIAGALQKPFTATRLAAKVRSILAGQ